MNELEKIYNDYLQGKATLAQVQAAVANSPEQAKYVADQMAAKDRGEKVAVSMGFLDLMKNIGFTAYSLNQIASAQRKQPIAPGLPTPPGLSPELTQALYQAQRGVNFAPVLEPARQGIEDAYTGSLNQAGAASGGQAGAYQSMAQAANVARMNAQLGLAPIAAQVQMGAQDNLNNLLGARVDERQQNYRNGLYGSQMAFDQYNNQIAGLSGQLTAGNQNLLNSAERVTQSLQDLTPYYAGFDEDTRKYMEDVRKENIGHFNAKGITNPITYNYQPDYSPISQRGYRNA